MGFFIFSKDDIIYARYQWIKPKEAQFSGFIGHES